MYQGRARLGRKTKELAKVLKPGEIGIIHHQDLDALGARDLAEAGAQVILNAADSITGRYPNLGPKLLLERRIGLIDLLGEEIFSKIEDGQMLTIVENQVYAEGDWLASGRLVDADLVAATMARAKSNINTEVAKFVTNTIGFMEKEKDLMFEKMLIPKIKTSLANKHVAVVVRGINYREDLKVIGPYIEEMDPVLIGVDGGADALLEYKHKPQIIIGDMDSISDNALASGAEILVHAYPDGRCPGAKRLLDLGIGYKIYPAPGTSEDIALLLAYELGAHLIVAVGLHSNIIDFLEKGREGMASTFLTRMKIGSILVDAKGVSQLYTGKTGLLHLPLLVAALVPIVMIIAMAAPWRGLLRLLWLQARLFLGGIF